MPSFEEWLAQQQQQQLGPTNTLAGLGNLSGLDIMKNSLASKIGVDPTTNSTSQTEPGFQFSDLGISGLDLVNLGMTGLKTAFIDIPKNNLQMGILKQQKASNATAMADYNTRKLNQRKALGGGLGTVPGVIL